MLINVNNN